MGSWLTNYFSFEVRGIAWGRRFKVHSQNVFGAIRRIGFRGLESRSNIRQMNILRTI